MPLPESIKAVSNGGNPAALLVTATELETEHLHQALSPMPGKSEIVKVHHGNHTYYLGILGIHVIVHVQCSMGSLSARGSTLTVSNAIRRWDPSVVIMIGIAFGIDESTQKIGDVIISKEIVNYESQRIGVDTTIARGVPTPCGVTILDRFLNSVDWIHISPSGKPASVTPGLLLSGEKLIDNLEFRNSLLKIYPAAVGGEMEGSGLAAASASLHKEWILVKGICDWADGNKSEDKLARQANAVIAAISLCRHVLNHESCLDGLNPIAEVSIADVSTEDGMLFSVYEPKMEPWYLERDTDRKIFHIQNNKHIWLWGPSGCGKTVSLLRLGHKKFKDLIFVDLSVVAGSSIEVILEEIFWTLSEFLGVEMKLSDKSAHSIIRSIYKLIFERRMNDSLIVIDEFSGISDATEFISLTSGLLIKLSNSPETRNNQIAIGSIVSPLGFSYHNDQKLHERVSIVPITAWSPQDCRDWIELVKEKLPWIAQEPFASDLVRESNGCPRRLKNLCRLHSEHLQEKSWDLKQTIRIHADQLVD